MGEGDVTGWNILKGGEVGFVRLNPEGGEKNIPNNFALSENVNQPPTLF